MGTYAILHHVGRQLLAYDSIIVPAESRPQSVYTLENETPLRGQIFLMSTFYPHYKYFNSSIYACD